MVSVEEFKKYRKQNYVDHKGVLKLCDEEIADFYFKLMAEYEFWNDGKPVNCCDCRTELTNPADMRRDGGACLCHNCLVKRRSEIMPTTKKPARMLENPLWRKFLDKITSEPVYQRLREKSLKINATPVRKGIGQYCNKAWELEAERKDVIGQIEKIVNSTIVPDINSILPKDYTVKEFRVYSQNSELDSRSRPKLGVPTDFMVSITLGYQGVKEIGEEELTRFNEYQDKIDKRLKQLGKISGLKIAINS